MREVPESVPASGAVGGAALTEVAWRKRREMYASVSSIVTKRKESMKSGANVLEGGTAHCDQYMYCFFRCSLTRTVVTSNTISDIACCLRMETC